MLVLTRRAPRPGGKDGEKDGEKDREKDGLDETRSRIVIQTQQGEVEVIVIAIKGQSVTLGIQAPQALHVGRADHRPQGPATGG